MKFNLFSNQGTKKSKKANTPPKKKKQKSKKKPKNCAPYIDSKKNNSCFDKKTLIKLIKAWNKAHKDNKIQYKTTEKHNILWNKLGAKMSNKCNNEYCWIKESFISADKDFIKDKFMPEKPKSWNDDPDEWLDTNNIFDVMVQYEVKYPEFRFFGPVPIDFDLKNEFDNCVVSELCKVNLKSLYKDEIKKIGIIFNIDKHTQGGSHWIGMYMDLTKKIIGYWDSYGYNPPNEVSVLMNKLQEQSKQDLNIDCNIKINKKRHQYKSSECGTYSINFIVEQLKGKSFNKVCNTIIEDDKMLSKRKQFFNYLN